MHPLTFRFCGLSAFIINVSGNDLRLFVSRLSLLSCEEGCYSDLFILHHLTVITAHERIMLIYIAHHHTKCPWNGAVTIVKFSRDDLSDLFGSRLTGGKGHECYTISVPTCQARHRLENEIVNAQRRRKWHSPGWLSAAMNHQMHCVQSANRACSQDEPTN